MNEEKQAKIIQEIIETEKSYLRQLELLQEFFSKPILERGLLPSHAHSAIFGQLSVIYKMNSELLEEMQKNDKNIGSHFLKYGPFFKVYSSYAKNFQKSLNILAQWESTNELLRSFIKANETRPEVQSKLLSLLIAPIQRIPRYRLLLEELMKDANPSNAEYNDLRGALAGVNDAAKHINQSVDESQAVQHLLLLQKALKNQQPNIIAPGRKLLAKGPLNKVSRKGNGSQERLFFLFSDMLMYTKMPQQDVGLMSKTNDVHWKPNSLECCCVLPLRYCRVTTVFGSTEQGITFRLQCSDEDLLLYSRCSSDGEKWIQTIKNAVKDALEKRKTLRKKSSKRRAVRKTTLKEIVWSDEKELSPTEEIQRDNENCQVVSEIMNRAEALKQRLQGITECLTPPKKEILPKKNLTENLPQRQFDKTSVYNYQTCNRIITDNYGASSHNPLSTTVFYYGERASSKRYRPKPLSPLATCSWDNHSTSTLRVTPETFIYRRGVRGREGSSVTPKQTPSSPPAKRCKRPPISEILSPWSKKKKAPKKFAKI